MSFQKPEYPKILTDADWQRSKGKIAKLGGETGIGKSMDKAEVAFKGIDWDELDLRKQMKGFVKDWTQKEIDTAFEQAKKQGGKLKVLETVLRELERDAKAVALEWKRNSLIPSSSVKRAEAVSDAAKAFSYKTALGTISAMLTAELKLLQKDFDAHRAVYAKLTDQLRKNVDDFPNEAKAVTLATYAKFWGQNIRAVGTVLPTLIKDHSELDADWKVWKQFSNQQKTPANDEDLKKQMEVLTKVAKSLKTKLARL